MQNDIYYEKYLKYKAKYLALKQQEGGLVTLKSGTYVFFCNSKYKDQPDQDYRCSVPLKVLQELWLYGAIPPS